MKDIKIIILMIALIVVSCVKEKPEPETEVIGQVTVDLNASKVEVRKKESIFGNLVVDGVSYALRKKGFDFDMAVINGGSLVFDHKNRPNGVYPAGDITNTDVNEMIPFFNLMVIVELTGRELYSVFERSSANVESTHGAFLQVSSEVKVVYDLNNQSQILNEIIFPNQIDTQGKRVASLMINNVEVDTNLTYHLLTSDFLSDGGDGYVDLRDIIFEHKENTKEEITELFISYVKENAPLTPELSNRITVLP
jgi:5'-nucleotidase